MCIAIYKPSDKEISKETLKSCFTSNRDGCGFAYINTDYLGKKKIIIKKSLDFETFYRQYQRAQRLNPESPFLIHFRIKTHGTVSKFNCHPFKIDENHAFIHNGVISGVGTDYIKSDTQLFNDKILKKLPEGWTKRSEITLLIEEMIAHSKVVVLNLEGDVQIYNESKGNWKDGIWYSNYSYKTYKAPTTPKYPYRSQTTYWKQCDECDKTFKSTALNYFCDEDDFKKLCAVCTSKQIKDELVLGSDTITQAIYDMWSDIEPGWQATASYVSQ